MKYLKSFSLLAMAILFLPIGSQAQDAFFTEISPIRAKLMVRNGALMVDVREVDEVAELAYDVENIINIPLSEIEDRLTEIPKDKELVMACRSGKRSRKAASVLMMNGFTNLVNLDGGIIAWQEKNLEVIGEGIVKKVACCANPNSKDCNPDGTCKIPSKTGSSTDAKTMKACCPGGVKDGKACCSKKKSK